jgi:hypothetical protein
MAGVSLYRIEANSRNGKKKAAALTPAQTMPLQGGGCAVRACASWFYTRGGKSKGGL